jgi:uncharacterized protein YukE
VSEPPGFAVDTDALDAHAVQVDVVARRARAAAAAGRAGPGPLAYGILGQVFAVAASVATRSGAATVERLADRTAALADTVRGARESYRQAERRATAEFRGPR